uniref:Uncharacterized protein n=1 Tax=Rhizophora mucronata TaxID=61149 RepID=A0A2P2R262_RHIMU
MSMQVLPTAPSPTVTHLMNLEALILFEFKYHNLLAQAAAVDSTK